MNDKIVVRRLRDLADRIESGEHEVTEISVGNLHNGDEVRVEVEVMPSDELLRIRKAFD